MFVGAAGLCGIIKDEVGELGVSVAIWEIMAMLKFEKIRTDEEYDAAMERIDEIFHAPVGSAEGDQLEVLVGLVEAWEGGDVFWDFFQIDKETGQPKGIVTLDLGGIR